MSTHRSTVGGSPQRSAAFLERARQEADRYGPDPWIFVRELLQNSRDAGASAVTFRVEERDGWERVSCVDDGEGMSFEHARRYLFALYASSKETSSNQAGKFGVGFWSILRFDPAHITIRCCTKAGGSWGMRLDGSLEQAGRVPGLAQPGTEITLERRGGDGRLEHRVHDAVWQAARYLHRRDDGRTPLPITVNGRRVNAEFALEAPSSSFRRGSVRGVVGLGPAPRVELFSRGLRVRAAASLDDLVAPTGRHTARMRVQFPELPGGLAPQALLESDELQVMLSRSDARDNRALTRLVKLAQQELERLIDRQLAQVRPRSWPRRVWDFFADRLRESLMLRTLLGSALGAAAALVIGWVLWGQTAPHNASATVQQTVPPPASSDQVMSAPRPYQDLAARYRGPRVDVLEPASAEPIQLQYTPADKRLHFASLVSSSLADDGSPLMESDLKTIAPYRGLTCDRNCAQVEVLVQGPGAIRLPVPTGYRLVSHSLFIGDERQSLQMTTDGHPVARLDDAVPVVVRYRSVAGPDPGPAIPPSPPVAVPAELRSLARALKPKMIEDRVAALLEEVRERVRYDRTPEVSRQHTAALDLGFVARTLAIGAGDCDVQNGLLVGLLHAAGVEARLAVGFIGSAGTTYPWLHAWVEYRDTSGTWRIADASDGAPAAVPPQLPPHHAAATVSGAPPSPTDDDDETVRVGPDGASRDAAAPPKVLTVDELPAEPVNAVFHVVASLDGRYPWVVRGIPLLLFALAGWSILGARTSRAVKLDDTPDLSRLLRGVLQQPGAFAQMSALFTRAIVPCVGGGAISVNRARELAAASRLYATASRPPLVRRAIRAKSIVLDTTTPEGSTVADSLGAIDLDRWAGWLDRATQSPLTKAVNATLARRGEDWSVSLATSMPAAVTVLDLGALGAKLRHCPSARVVLVDPRAPGIERALEVSVRSPKRGALMLLDRLADQLDLERPRRAALLSRAAKEALAESFPPSRA
ncbi:MAG: ATP-binding protein [Nannocystaceae bacterium]|nr:ATP-binding protein [Nannocystaceae bacterium]